MTDYVGGFRERLIHDSLYYLVFNGLDDLGWFDAGREHLPITVVTEPFENDEEIPLNTIVIYEEDTRDNDAEMGSTLGDIISTYYIDFYAENNTIGKDVIHDVRDLLRGRHTAADRTSSVLFVYDYTMTTPPLIFSCDIEDVVIGRARDFPNPWQKHWYSCRLDLVDSYDG